jgi:hypothetical protein
MNRRLVTVAAVGAAALALLGGLGSGRASALLPLALDCPADASSFAEPWQLVSAGEGSVRLADRDGDGSVCVARVVVRGRVLLTLFTDDSIGKPELIPPGPCTDPFVPFKTGHPNIFPGTREIDANGDGVLCGNVSLAVRGLIIVLLDNPNPAVR